MINRRWLPLNALRAFDAVGQNLSFTAGAQALHVSQSAISRHVIGLEELLGKQLLERRPQRVALTAEGAMLLPVVSKALDRLEQALNLIQRGARSRRTLRIQMPPSLLHQLGLSMIRDFRREFPDVMIDVTSTAVTGLPAHELDVAVVYDRPNVDDKVTDLLWMVRTTPVCAPQVAERFAGRPLQDFLSENELLHVKLEHEPRALLWTSFVRQCGLALETERGLAFDTAISAVQFAAAGAGVALVDVDMFARELSAGTLVAPYEASFEDGYGYYAKFHAEDLSDPMVSQFRRWIIARFTGEGAQRTFGRAPVVEVGCEPNGKALSPLCADVAAHAPPPPLRGPPPPLRG